MWMAAAVLKQPLLAQCTRDFARAISHRRDLDGLASAEFEDENGWEQLVYLPSVVSLRCFYPGRIYIMTGYNIEVPRKLSAFLF